MTSRPGEEAESDEEAWPDLVTVVLLSNMEDHGPVSLGQET